MVLITLLQKLNGWLTNTQLRTVRKTMKTKLKKMVELAKEGPTRTNEINVDEDEDEEEFSAKEGNDKEGKAIFIQITVSNF